MWSLSYLGGNHQQLLSASADGTVKLWSPISKSTSSNIGAQQLVKTFGYSPITGKLDGFLGIPLLKVLYFYGKWQDKLDIVLFAIGTTDDASGNNSTLNVVPTAVDWVYEDPAHMVTGYSNAACVIYDIETGKSVVQMDTLQVRRLNICFNTDNQYLYRYLNY